MITAIHNGVPTQKACKYKKVGFMPLNGKSRKIFKNLKIFIFLQLAWLALLQKQNYIHKFRTIIS